MSLPKNSKKYSKKTRRTFRKKKSTALTRATNRGTMVYRGQPGIADRALLKLRYRDNYTLSSSTVPFVQRAWRLNSIYDPDFTGSGHQPLCYDQWQVFYKNYRVYKTDIIYSIVNETQRAVQMGFVIQPDDSGVSGDDASFEQPHVFTKILGGQEGQNRSVIKRTIHHPRIIGQTSIQYRSNENTYAAFGTNPNTNVFGILFCQAVDGASLPDVSVTVQMIFHVELFGRKDQALSNTDGLQDRGSD